jgi:hypothetical protein
MNIIYSHGVASPFIEIDFANVAHYITRRYALAHTYDTRRQRVAYIATTNQVAMAASASSVAGASDLNELCCPQCRSPEQNAVPVPEMGEDWLVHFHCLTCQYRSHVCSLCPGYIFDSRHEHQADSFEMRIYNKQRVKDHGKSKRHMNNAKVASTESTSRVIDSESCNVGFEEMDDENLFQVDHSNPMNICDDEGHDHGADMSVVVPPFDEVAVIGVPGVGADHNLHHHLPMNFEDPEHTAGLGSAHHVRYFKAAAQSPNRALEYIIKTGIFGADADVSTFLLPEIDVLLQTAIVSLVSDLSIVKQGKLQLIFDLICRKYKHDHPSLPTVDECCDVADVSSDANENTYDSPPALEIRSTRLPDNFAEFRSFYTDGPTAILPTLPRPPGLESLPNGDSYVPLRSSITFTLAMGHASVGYLDSSTVAPEGFTGPVKSILQTRRARVIWNGVPDELKALGVQVLLVQPWRDGWEPNYICTNKGSAWGKTAYVVPRDGERATKHNAMIVALGLEDESHEEVQCRFDEELQVLGNTVHYYYDRKTGTRRPLLIKLYSDGVDKPERSTQTGVGGHSGLTTGTFGIVCNPAENRDRLVSCKDCHQKRLDTPSGFVPPCSVCCNFDLLDARMMWEVPKDFPTEDVNDYVLSDEELEDSPPRYMLPFAQSFARMQQTVERVHLNRVSSSIWTKKEAECFARTNGINGKVAAAAMKADYAELSVWSRGTALEQHINAPMHLHFLGIGKAIPRLYFDVLSSVKRLSTFLEILRGRLRLVSDQSIVWFKAVDCGLTGKMGGLVSENYLALTRGNKWFFFDVETMLRGTSYSDPGAVSELVPAWLAVIARIMQSTVTEDLPDDVDRHVKIFLSVVDRVDRALQKIDSPEVTAAAIAAAVAAATTNGDTSKRKRKRDQLVWERKGNLTSLTRIKDEMKMYGSPRDNLYEGNFRGEGVIRELKPAVPTIHRKNWSKNGIAEVHVCRTVNILEPEIASPPRRYNNFNSFKDREELVKSLDEGKVVSGVVFEERLLAVIEGKQGTEYFELCFDDNNTDASIMASACWFAPAKPALTAWKIKEEKLKEYFVILPREKRAPTVAPSYYAITSEWRERLRDGSICFPRSVGATY